MGKTLTMNSNLDMLVRDQLRQKILSGELDGGFHLSELKISKEFNVSRTPVREALCALAADGLVEMVPHRGAFVTHVPASTKVDQMQSYGLFLGLAAKLAAEKASIEILLDMEAAFAFASDDSMSSPDYLKALDNIIEMIEKVAASSTISEALVMVRRRTDMQAMWATAVSQRKDMNTQLVTLLGALKRKKGDVAEKTMRQLASVAITAWLSARKLSVAPVAQETSSNPMIYSRTRAVQKALQA
jgi:DNA-binding GntR family transcriptional regulator